MLASAGGTGADEGAAGCEVVVAGGSVLLLLGARPVAGARGRPSRRLGVGAEGGGDVGAAGAACKGLRYTKAEARACSAAHPRKRTSHEKRSVTTWEGREGSWLSTC